MADLYLQGLLQADIADQLGIDQSTVSRDLKALQSEWLASALVDFDEVKSQEMAKIDRLEREYWQAWVRSCEDAEQTRSCEDAEQTTQEGTLTNVDEVKKTSKGHAGDPRFLKGVQWCIERRCKILGVDAPERHEISGGVQLIGIDPDAEAGD
jgi:predicted transcriptional regulator